MGRIMVVSELLKRAPIYNLGTGKWVKLLGPTWISVPAIPSRDTYKWSRCTFWLWNAEAEFYKRMRSRQALVLVYIHATIDIYRSPLHCTSSTQNLNRPPTYAQHAPPAPSFSPSAWTPPKPLSKTTATNSRGRPLKLEGEGGNLLRYPPYR